ncbi:MAG: hypothetical protein J6W08_02665 [Alphaproteobacteria bacterium]|nr:hypothetical protein [Alphaproteobacteria bacterium]MBR0212458.1 hypothetical protein [Alphaproteobacteria bacterium]
MSEPVRLFLFAGYDKDNIVADSLVYYVQALSRYGDVIVCMDNELTLKELQKIKPYTTHAIATRHGEYDFGSYKRMYQYARDKKILNKYDEIYLVNDSVFGPLFDIKTLLHKIEKLKFDASGIIVAKHETHSYIESWFVKLNKKIFTSLWFDEFMNNVQKQPTKIDVTIKYEHGLTNLIKNNGCSWGGIFTVYGRKTYNNPKSLFMMGNPFVKKLSFTRHNGALGKQIKYILNHSDFKATLSIMSTANRLYGENYMKSFLTSNPLKIIYRNISYIITKIKNGKI